MSKIKVNRLENTSTANGGIDIDTSGHVQVDGLQMPTAGPLSNRNLMINGAMTVNQRSTSMGGLTSSKYGPCDRYKFMVNSLGHWTITQNTDAPSGFSNSFKLDCITADSSPASGDYVFIKYVVEAQDLQLLGTGTADAKSLTMSFWVKSNKTGDTSFNVNSPDGGDRAFITTYNISAADTWEYKTISIPADTGGTINNDSGEGFEIEWWLNSGSTYTGSTPAAGWVSRVDATRNTSNLGIGGSSSDYFQITGVQLEVGSKATPFEHRSYGDELAKCQRYYEVHGAQLDTAQNGSGTSYGTWYFKQTKRDTPSTASDTGGIKTGTNVLSSTGWQIYKSAGALRMTVNAYVSSEL